MKGISITPRKIIDTLSEREDEMKHKNGRLIELYKHGDKTQVYLSTIYPQEFKGWHKHKKLTQRFICIKGTVTVIMITDDNIREEHILLATKPEVLEIKPGIAIGIRGVSDEEAFLICMPDPMYDPEEKEEKVVISGESYNF